MPRGPLDLGRTGDLSFFEARSFFAIARRSAIWSSAIPRSDAAAADTRREPRISYTLAARRGRRERSSEDCGAAAEPSARRRRCSGLLPGLLSSAGRRTPEEGGLASILPGGVGFEPLSFFSVASAQEPPRYLFKEQSAQVKAISRTETEDVTWSRWACVALCGHAASTAARRTPLLSTAVAQAAHRSAARICALGPTALVAVSTSISTPKSAVHRAWAVGWDGAVRARPASGFPQAGAVRGRLFRPGSVEAKGGKAHEKASQMSASAWTCSSCARRYWRSRL